MAEIVTEVLSVTDKWHLRSVDLISSLQYHLEPYESWVVQASVLGDNREAFMFFFPLLAGLLNDLGARTLWAAILVEWSNLLLKWLFVGDRPYWWIGETSLYTDETRPQLRKFPNTCEAGPGTPSGHLMMNVAIFYVITRGISAEFIWKWKSLSKCQKTVVAASLYFIYFLWIGVISISRLYIQAHFIHQNILGAFMGLVVGHFAWSSPGIVRYSKLKAVLMAAFLITSAVSIYMLLLSKGMDPLWTLPLALKHCARVEYVRIDTQPFFIMARFTGTALGLGLGLSSEKRLIVLNSPRNIIRTILTMKAGVILGRIASLIQASLPADDLVLFLMLSLSLSIALPLIVIALLPHFLLTMYYDDLASTAALLPSEKLNTKGQASS